MAKTSEYGLGTFTFPRGWFALAKAAELGEKPIAAHAFGKDFVVYRGAGGKPVILDAYCPHMGTHLASGQLGATARLALQIDGDTIRCPLHGWRFGAAGQCVEIPYSRIPIPPSAHLNAYPARAHAGLILIWHDEEGAAPHYEPVDFPEWNDGSWLRSEIKTLGDFAMHPAEIVDHHVDKIHHVVTHGFDNVPGFVTTFEGHRLSQYLCLQRNTPDGPPAHLKSVSDYRGAGIMLVRIEGERPFVSFFAHTPLEDGRLRAWHGLAVKASGPVPTTEDKAVIEGLLVMLDNAYKEDMEILERKRPSLRPLQIPGDGPFRLVRKWYGQFYNPRAEAKAIHAQIDGAHPTDGDVPAPWAHSGRVAATVR